MRECVIERSSFQWLLPKFRVALMSNESQWRVWMGLLKFLKQLLLRFLQTRATFPTILTLKIWQINLLDLIPILQSRALWGCSVCVSSGWVGPEQGVCFHYSHNFPMPRPMGPADRLGGHAHRSRSRAFWSLQSPVHKLVSTFPGTRRRWRTRAGEPSTWRTPSSTPRTPAHSSSPTEVRTDILPLSNNPTSEVAFVGSVTCAQRYLIENLV